MSSNSSLDFGSMIVFIPMMFSCLSSLSNFNSLSVLFVNILCSKAFSIFFIATKLFSSSTAFLSFAATTIPYAPYPIESINSYLSSISNLV